MFPKLSKFYFFTILRSLELPDGGAGGDTFDGKLTKLIIDSCVSSDPDLGGSSFGRGMLSGKGMFCNSSMLSI